VINASDFGDMVDVVDQRFQGRTGNFGVPLARMRSGVDEGNSFSGGLELVGVGLDGGGTILASAMSARR